MESFMKGLSKLLFTLMISFSSTSFTQDNEGAVDIEEVIK